MKEKIVIKETETLNEGDFVGLNDYCPQDNRVFPDRAPWTGIYALAKRVSGDIYEILYLPLNRKRWDLLVLGKRYAQAHLDWERFPCHFKITNPDYRTR